MRNRIRMALMAFALTSSACPSDPLPGARIESDAGPTAGAAARAADADAGLCPAGTAGRSCAPCPAGSYCPGGRQPMSLCGTYQYDDDQDPTTPCVAASSCPAGTRVAQPYSRVTNQRCAACPSNTFSATTDAHNCTPWTECGDDQYEAQRPSTTQDRVCASFVECTADEFVAQPGTATHDRMCQHTHVCQPGEYEVEGPSADSDRRCASCPLGSYSTQENAAACSAWSDCDDFSYEAAAGDATRDRSCAKLSDCLPGEYRPDNADHRQPSCRSCPSGTHSAHANAQSCTAWTRCHSGEYERGAPSASRDRSCAALTVCHAGEYVLAAATATSDRVCTVCPLGRFSAGDNASECRTWRVCTDDEHEVSPPSAARDRVCAKRAACETNDVDAGASDGGACDVP